MLQLFVGLVLYSWTMAMLVQADLGLDPWDVFHQGIAGRVGLTFGQVVIVTGAFVLLGWLPLRQKPGVGTVANVIVIGLAADLGIALMQRPDPRVWQRDGLWVCMVRTIGLRVRLWVPVFEVTVRVVGFILGVTVGVGTVLCAIAIGPIVKFFLPLVQAGLRRLEK